MTETEWARLGKLAATLRDYAQINNCAILCASQKDDKTWGVYNQGDILCSSKDGITEEQALQYAINWNDLTKTVWYMAKPIPIKN